MGEQALWHRLALSRDRLCCARFLGSFSPEARGAAMVTTEDPRPFLSTQRFFPGAAGGELGMIEGRCGEGKRVLRCFLEFNIFTCFDLL